MKNLKCIPYDEIFDDGSNPILTDSQEVAELVKLFGLPENVTKFTLHAGDRSVLYIDCTYYSLDILDLRREKFALVPADQEPT